MDPKDPHLIVKCAKILMTLPIMVRDFNLGKQYLTKAFEMAPNDGTVLQAIENTVQAYKDIVRYIQKYYSFNVLVNCYFVNFSQKNRNLKQM